MKVPVRGPEGGLGRPERQNLACLAVAIHLVLTWYGMYAGGIHDSVLGLGFQRTLFGGDYYLPLATAASLLPSVLFRRH